MMRTVSLGPPTRVSGISRRRARAYLLTAAGLLAWAVWSAQFVTPWVFSTLAVGDLDFYRAVVARVHAGEGYYTVAGEELVAGHFATQSTFNWRLPTYAWLLGSVPDTRIASAVLCGLAFVSVIAAAHTLLGREVGAVGTVAGVVLLLGGMFSWMVYDPAIAYHTEAWSEVLLLLSLAAY